jgi:hypothetical protein
MHNNNSHLRVKDISRFDEVAQAFIVENNIQWYCDHKPVLSHLEMELLDLFNLPKVMREDPRPFVTKQPAIFPVDDRNILTRFWDWIEEKLS